MNDQQNWAQIPACQYPVLKKLKRIGKRWRNEQIYFDSVHKRYMHKDPLHGEVEVYNKKGDHIGVLTPEGHPHLKKERVKGRTIRDILK